MARFFSKFGSKSVEAKPTAAAKEEELPPMRMEPGAVSSCNISNNNSRSAGPTSYRGNQFSSRGGSMNSFGNETDHNDGLEDDGTATSVAGWSVDALTVGTRSNFARAGDSVYDFDSFKTRGGLSKWNSGMVSSIFVGVTGPGNSEREAGTEEKKEEDNEEVETTSKIAMKNNEKNIEAVATKSSKRGRSRDTVMFLKKVSGKLASAPTVLLARLFSYRLPSKNKKRQNQ